MKKNLILLLAFVCASFTSNVFAQELRLWGTTNGSTLGPPDGYGALYSLKLDGTDIRAEYKFQSFTDPNGSILNSGVYQASDGYLYGTARYGGVHGKGTIFRIRPDGTCFQKLHDFTGADGEDPHAGLIEASNGKLYGTTTGGGAYQAGTIFSISRQGHFEVLRHSKFNEPYTTRATLIQAPNGYLYGTAPQGGPHNKGGVFKIKTDGTGYQIVVAFDGTNGAFSQGGLISASDGKLYGAATYGGVMDGGRIYYIDLTNDSFHTVFEFTQSTSHGMNPTSKLLESADGYLYGTTINGGTNYGGTVYRVKKDGTDFSIRHSFGSIPNDGYLSEPGLIQLPNGKIFGITVLGGTTFQGTIYTLDSNGSNYTKIHDITADLGSGPRYKLELVTPMAPLVPITITSVNATPDPINAGKVAINVEFTGSATSSSINWGDGTTSSGTFTSAGLLTASHQYASAGTYEVTVQVSGDCTSATQTIQVEAQEPVTPIVITNVTAPVAPVPVGNVTIGVDFTGPATSSSINWGDGATSSGVFVSATSLTASHDYTAPGTYEVKIQLSSDAGATALHTIQYITVYKPIVPIVITFVTHPVNQVPIGNVDISVDFTGPATSSIINWGDGTTSSGNFVSANLLTASHAYTAAGEYEVFIELSSDDGQKALWTIQYIVVYDPVVPLVITNVTAPTEPVPVGNVDIHVDFIGPASGASIDWGDGTISEGGFISASALEQSHEYTSPGIYPVVIKLRSSSGAIVSHSLSITVYGSPSSIVITSVTSPPGPMPIGNVDITVNFIGPATSSSINWGDGTTSSGVFVSEGVLTANHNYMEAGVYEVSIQLSSDAGASASHTIQYIVVYDPSGGFVTGGGHFTSPAGAYITEPEVSGKAQFGFVAKYIKGNSTPSGNTVFKLLAGNLSFKSTSLDWLVVAGYKAMYKGEGSVNGNEGYRFRVSAIDGDRETVTSADKFRIMIWDSSGQLVYDNQLGAEENADATTAIDEGSIVIHAPATARESSAGTYPNPFTTKLAVEYQSADKTPVRFLMVDVMGRTLLTQSMPHAAHGFYELSVDDAYKGIAVLQISQSTSSTVIKVTKE